MSNIQTWLEARAKYVWTNEDEDMTQRLLAVFPDKRILNIDIAIDDQVVAICQTRAIVHKLPVEDYKGLMAWLNDNWDVPSVVGEEA